MKTKKNKPTDKKISKLEELLNGCKEFKMDRFKEADKSIYSALHIPYSGMGNPDYVTIDDYLIDDVTNLITELAQCGHPETDKPITNIEELSEAWEDIDYAGTLHEHAGSSLTWQQGLRESDIILRELSDYEETDTGLWENLQPEEAITAKAFWTYKTAIFTKGQEIIERYIK